METKRRSYMEAVRHIPDNAVIGTSSFGIGGLPEQLIAGVGEYYEENQHPKNITLATTAGIGVGKGRGLDHLIKPGLLKRAVVSHIATSPIANQAAHQNDYELFMIPQGMIGKLYQNAASRGPGVFSKVGIDTFVDPNNEGGKMNDMAKDNEDIVESIELNGERWLHYKPLPINVAFIKASYADQNGNLSMKRESAFLESVSLATAAHNAGGVVIAQVEEMVENHSIPAQEVAVPGMLVDYVVVNEKPEYHMQTAGTVYSPILSNEIRIARDAKYYKKPLDPKRVMVRRASQEIPKDSIVNLGNGIAASVGEVIAEADALKDYHLTTDLGAVGGLPATGYNYAPNINADAVINTEDMFNLYHGKGLDVAVLGFGQMNALGNMNTTKIGDYFIGPGGMIDISNGADKIVFVGTHVVKGKTEVVDGKIVVTEEGIGPKFVSDLQYVTFSAEYAHKMGKEILVITDRAVFDFTEEGKMRLIEIAPGLNLEKDVLDWMAFKPVISDQLREMDAALFNEDWTKTNLQINH